jgi:HEAT repeat protein
VTDSAYKADKDAQSDFSITEKTLLYTTNEGISILINDLKDNEWEKRWLSTYLLGNIKEQQAYDLIKSNAKNDDDKRVRFMSRKVLGRYKK